MNTILLGLILIFQVAGLVFGSWLTLNLDVDADHRSHFDAGCLMVLSGFGCLDVFSGNFEFLLLVGELLVLISLLLELHPLRSSESSTPYKS